jgi:phosphoglycolate phosphatase
MDIWGILTIVLVVVIISVAIFYYVYAKKHNPCALCDSSSMCHVNNKNRPKWVKDYYKCYGHKNTRNIFLDFNGTVLDDLDLSFNLINEMATICNVKPITKEEYRNSFTFPVKKYYESIGFDWSVKSFEELSVYFIEKYTERWKAETKVFKDFKKYIKKLRSAGFHVYILTASEENLLKSQLDYFGLNKYLDGFVASKDIHAKGKIEYGKEYLAQNNINPKQSVMIGDTMHDYEVAIELGMTPIMYTSGHNSKERLEKTGAKTVNNYKELYKLLNK